VRIGLGYDIHRLQEGLPLVLAGVTIDHPLGLLGHSDADVVFHALIDSILGAIGQGDIGTHFPDHDPTWEGARGATLLSRTMDLIPPGWSIENVDINILAQKVRIAPHRQAMQSNLAHALQIETDRVNIKGKTGENVGPVGREEAIEAQVVILFQNPPPHSRNSS